MLKKPKLRTYAAFKLSFSTEIYVKQTLSTSRRSFLFWLRLCVLPLELKTEILCTLCNTGSCEDEIHFLSVYPLYKDLI